MSFINSENTVSYNLTDVLVFILVWLGGIVVAKGFWSTLFSILFFPYSFYLLVEAFLKWLGWV